MTKKDSTDLEISLKINLETGLEVGLAIFDLDNTLLGGDSDLLWGEFLCNQGYYADQEGYREQHAGYYRSYQDGQLDLNAFLAFQLKPLADTPKVDLLQWRDRFINDCITPIILPKAEALVARHREKKHQLLIATATNRFIAEPVAALFGIDHLIATNLEMRDGEFTGRTVGTPSFREGKRLRLEQWVKTQRLQVTESWFYSDSHNDVSLLEAVDHPVAVDPDNQLRTTAIKRGWPVISLR